MSATARPTFPKPRRARAAAAAPGGRHADRRAIFATPARSRRPLPRVLYMENPARRTPPLRTGPALRSAARRRNVRPTPARPASPSRRAGLFGGHALDRDRDGGRARALVEADAPPPHAGDLPHLLVVAAGQGVLLLARWRARADTSARAAARPVAPGRDVLDGGLHPGEGGVVERARLDALGRRLVLRAQAVRAPAARAGPAACRGCPTCGP